MKNKTLLIALFGVVAVPVFAAFADLQSGVEPGGMVKPFHPKHVTGADAGTDTCPP